MYRRWTAYHGKSLYEYHLSNAIKVYSTKEKGKGGRAEASAGCQPPRESVRGEAGLGCVGFGLESTRSFRNDILFACQGGQKIRKAEGTGLNGHQLYGVKQMHGRYRVENRLEGSSAFTINSLPNASEWNVLHGRSRLLAAEMEAEKVKAIRPLLAEDNELGQITYWRDENAGFLSYMLKRRKKGQWMHLKSAVGGYDIVDGCPDAQLMDGCKQPRSSTAEWSLLDAAGRVMIFACTAMRLRRTRCRPGKRYIDWFSKTIDVASLTKMKNNGVLCKTGRVWGLEKWWGYIVALIAAAILLTGWHVTWQTWDRKPDNASDSKIADNTYTSDIRIPDIYQRSQFLEKWRLLRGRTSNVTIDTVVFALTVKIPYLGVLITGCADILYELF